jgi:hypothetical protein
VCVNDWMLINKYAVKYDGGTKIRPHEWNWCELVWINNLFNRIILYYIND